MQGLINYVGVKTLTLRKSMTSHEDAQCVRLHAVKLVTVTKFKTSQAT